MFSIVVFTDAAGGIGMNDGTIPLRIDEDLQNFKNLTTDNIVIMGRKTWDSLPDKYRPLPNRLNIIISSNKDYGGENIMVFDNIINCMIELQKKKYKNKEKFVIGGGMIYKYFIENNLVHRFYISKLLHKNFNCDVSINIPFEDNKCVCYLESDVKLYKNYSWIYKILEFKNNEELNFINTLKNILDNGEIRYDRTGAGTKAIFNNELIFDISKSFPLITTRAMNLRLIFEELIFFLRGQTNNKILESKNVKIWTPNTTRDFLDKRGLNHYEEGDMGATYGFLFRHQGADYIDCNTNYEGCGFDQLAEVIRLLKEDPYSRRIIINLWDPKNMHKMSLPPCLFNYQFYVSNERILNCKLTQRSSDISLAGGWNIATGALLTYMLAHICDMKPGRLIWSTGDTHIYLNQLDGVKEQIKREPRIFPRLFFKEGAPSYENKKNITDFEYDDLILVNYNPHPIIKLAMNA